MPQNSTVNLSYIVSPIIAGGLVIFNRGSPEALRSWQLDHRQCPGSPWLPYPKYLSLQEELVELDSNNRNV